MPKSALFALLVTAGAIMPGVALGQGPMDVAMAGPQPHFVAAWAPEKEREAEHSAALARRVSLELQDVSLDAALKALTNRAGLRITYSQAILPKGKRVTIQAGDIAVVTALTEMLFRSGLDVVVDQDGTLALVRCKHVAPRAEVQDSGTIIGTVTDKATGSPLPGATVVIEGTQLSATANTEGQYRVDKVRPGTYTVRARYIGYAVLSSSITVGAGEEVRADFGLQKSTQKLDELVTVTPGGMQTEAKALPSPVTVITSDVIKAQAPRTVQELVRQAVPGAVSWDQASRPTDAAFSVRGAATLNPGGTQMKVFVDGMQVANENANLLDPQSIDRIEVIRGPQAAALFGSDAIGGVIQIYTRRGAAGSRPRLQGEASYGLVETPYSSPQGGVRQQYSANVSGGTTDVTYNIGASYWHLGNWLPPAGELSAQSSPNVFGGVRYARGVLALEVSGRYGIVNVGGALHPELLTSGFVPFSRPQFVAPQNVSDGLAARLVLTPLRGWSHSVTAGFDDYELQSANRQPRFTTPADSFLSIFSATQSKRWIGYNTTLDFRTGAHVGGSLTAGFDHNNQPTQSVSTSAALPQDPNLPSASAFRLNSNNTGYFLQGQVAIDDAVFLTGGVRAEQNTNFGDSLGTPISPRAGVSYVRNLGDLTVKLRGSWGRAIRAPNSALKLSLGPDITPNPRLAPERQEGWDAGLDLQFGNWGSLGLTYYDQVAKNLIQQVPIQTQPTFLYQFQNVGRVKNRGLEAEVSLSSDWLHLNGVYAYTRARIEDLGSDYTGDLVVGDQVRATPKHTAGVLLTTTLRTGTTVTAGLAYVGSYSQVDFLALFRCLGGTGACPPDFRFVTNYPDFAKLNVGFTQRLAGSLSALFRIDNLTNTAVSENGNIFAAMGRITTIGLRFDR